jgi:2-dehydro-3-deoxyglucarate aldolase/4-hydroxy-2-oxoheptanedioate aldolase
VEKSFKSRLAQGEILVGPLVTLPSPEVAEILAGVGFDYLWIETEHAPMNLAQAQMMIQAVGGRCPCVLRVPENAEAWIKRALDVGCDGIVIPQVKSAVEAEEAVRCCLYPPAGKRGVGIGRAHGYGLSFQEYVEVANDQLVIILQVEHIDGVRNIRSIAATPGVDAILIGPFDLSGSLGLLGQINHPQVRDAIEEIIRHCEAAQVPVGMFAVDPVAAKQCIDDGVTLIALGMDVLYLSKAAKQALDEVQPGKS